MDDYTKELERRLEELQQKLTAVEQHVALYTPFWYPTNEEDASDHYGWITKNGYHILGRVEWKEASQEWEANSTSGGWHGRYKDKALARATLQRIYSNKT